jgi:hypothetical protein
MAEDHAAGFAVGLNEDVELGDGGRRTGHQVIVRRRSRFEYHRGRGWASQRISGFIAMRDVINTWGAQGAKREGGGIFGLGGTGGGDSRRRGPR